MSASPRGSILRSRPDDSSGSSPSPRPSPTGHARWPRLAALPDGIAHGTADHEATLADNQVRLRWDDPPVDLFFAANPDPRVKRLATPTTA